METPEYNYLTECALPALGLIAPEGYFLLNSFVWKSEQTNT